MPDAFPPPLDESRTSTASAAGISRRKKSTLRHHHIQHDFFPFRPHTTHTNAFSVAQKHSSIFGKRNKTQPLCFLYAPAEARRFFFLVVGQLRGGTRSASKSNHNNIRTRKSNKRQPYIMQHALSIRSRLACLLGWPAWGGHLCCGLKSWTNKRVLSRLFARSSDSEE